MGLPGPQVDAFSSFAGSIHDLTEQMNLALQDQGVVYLPGQGREDISRALQDIVPAGTVVAFHGTLVQARWLRGWRVADGSSGTPNLMDRALRFSAPNEGSGATGGSGTHTHTPGTGATTELAATGLSTVNESSHTHTQDATGPHCIEHKHSQAGTTPEAIPHCHGGGTLGTGTGGYSSGCAGCGATIFYASWNHCHASISGNTAEADCLHAHPNPATNCTCVCHCHTNSMTDAGSAHNHTTSEAAHTHPLDGGSFTIDAASSWPPWWKGIPIIKL